MKRQRREDRAEAHLEQQAGPSREGVPGDAASRSSTPHQSPAPSPPLSPPPLLPLPSSPVRSPTRSLNSSRQASQQSLPDQQPFPHPWRQHSDGNLSDLAAPERNVGGNGRADEFFARLLDDQANPDYGAEAPEPLGDFLDGDEPDLPPEDIIDEDYGIPAAQEHPREEPLWDLNHLHQDHDVDILDVPDVPDEPGDPELDFAAFDEPDAIRNAYVDVFIQKTHFRAKHDALKHQLRSHRRNLQHNPTVSPDDLSKMAQTIQTAERRLGISTSDIITTYTVCPDCKRRYNPAYIATAEHNQCENNGCNGILFDVKELASRERRRISRLTYPVASITTWLRRLLSYPGIAELMQNWRDGPDDDEEDTEPITPEQWRDLLEIDRILSDISTGYGWRAAEAALERIVDPEADARGEDLVTDRRTSDEPLRFVSLKFGVSLSMNTDW